MLLTLDLETSIHNKGNPFDTRNFVVSSHTKSEAASTVFGWFTDADFLGNLKREVAGCSLLVGANVKFDLHHLRNLGIRLPSRARVWDVMLAEFILSGQRTSFASLNQLAEQYGLGAKESVVAEYWAKGISTENIPRDIVESYGNLDTDLTHAVYLRQRTDPRLNPKLEKLIMLAGLDLLVLQEMEFNGFKYNVVGSRASAETLSQELVRIEEELGSHAPTRVNWNSGDQLSCFLFGGSFDEELYLPVESVYKSGPRKGLSYVQNHHQGTTTHRFSGFFKPIKGTEIAKSTDERPLYSTAADVLSKLRARDRVGRRILTLLNRHSYLSKLIGTYLLAMPDLIVEMNWADDLIHGQFNQVVARTGRLSSSKPNMQNASEEVDQFFISRFTDV